MNLRDRLEALGVRKGAPTLASDANRQALRLLAIQDLIDGQVVHNAAGEFFLTEQRYEGRYCHGRLSLAQFLQQRPETLARLAQDARLTTVTLGDVAFIDIETTGLAGGTGTYAFLIGLGSFDPQGDFVVRQFFMRDYGDEPAQLLALEAELSRFGWIVSFNGKAFDIPLIQTRLAMWQKLYPLAGAPHLDLLFPARRLWQSTLPSCALSSLERGVLQISRAGDDVPGYLIPSLYFGYLRSADARPLRAIFYHNQQDILSLVSLAARLAQALDDPLAAGLSPLEMLGVGRFYEDAGMLAECSQAYTCALQGPLPTDHERQALRRLALLYKRSGLRQEAVDIWKCMLDDDGDPLLEPYVELAKHYEWTEPDYGRALEYTTRAITLATHGRRGPQRKRCLAELEHRGNRLQRKMSGKARQEDEVIPPGDRDAVNDA